MLLIEVEVTLETSAERGSGDQCRGDDGKLLIRRFDARQPRFSVGKRAGGGL